MTLGLILNQGLSINYNYIFIYSPKYVFEEKLINTPSKKSPILPKWFEEKTRSGMEGG